MVKAVFMKVAANTLIEMALASAPSEWWCSLRASIANKILNIIFTTTIKTVIPTPKPMFAKYCCKNTSHKPPNKMYIKKDETHLSKCKLVKFRKNTLFWVC